MGLWDLFQMAEIYGLHMGVTNYLLAEMILQVGEPPWKWRAFESTQSHEGLGNDDFSGFQLYRWFFWWTSR